MTNDDTGLDYDTVEAAGGLDYEIVDVFTDVPFAGNPLAVVFGAEGLETAQLQTLAQEFGLSETAFPLPATQPAASYRLRIFTPGAELPFAGHPSIGTAWVLRRRGLLHGVDVVQECDAGLLPLALRTDGSVALTGAPPSVSSPLPDAVRLAELVGLAIGDLTTPPRTAGTGVDYAVLAVAPDAVGRAAAGPELAAALARRELNGLVVVGWDAAASHAHLRMFAPHLGVVEDPATGSAATALGGYLVAAGLLPGDGTSAYTIAQGAEIGRPSQLAGEVEARDGAPVACRVAGRVASIARGRVVVPPVAAD